MEVIELLREELAAVMGGTRRLEELQGIVRRTIEDRCAIPQEVLAEIDAIDADLMDRRARIVGYTRELEADLPEYPALNYPGGDWD